MARPGSDMTETFWLLYPGHPFQICSGHARLLCWTFGDADVPVLLPVACRAVCAEYKVHNADIHFKEDCVVEDLIDIIEGSRIYIPAIYVLNKIDQITTEVGSLRVNRVCRS